MKSAPMLAVGLLSAACFAGATPVTAHTTAAINAQPRAAAARVQSGMNARVFSTSVVRPQTRTGMPNEFPTTGSNPQLNGMATVTSVNRSGMTLRFASGSQTNVNVQDSRGAIMLRHMRVGSRVIVTRLENGAVRVTAIQLGTLTCNSSAKANTQHAGCVRR